MRYERGDFALDVRAVDVQGVAASQALFPRSGWLLGYCLAETTGTGPATVALFDGPDPNGTILVTVTLPAGASVTQHPGTPGWPLDQGLFLQVLAGTVTASAVVAEQVR